MASANAWQDDPAKVACVRQQQEDMQWVSEHYLELDKQYQGKHIAVFRKQVVGHGADLGELKNRMAQQGYELSDVSFAEFPSVFDTLH
jgi:hypothetical protein